MKSGNYDEAMRSLDKVIELDSKNASAYINISKNKSKALESLNKYEEAIQTLNEAEKIIPV